MVQEIDKKEIIFVSEQDGDVEREFKNELNKLFFATEKDIRGYLVLVQYPNIQEFNVALCLKTDSFYDDFLLKKCTVIFKSIFSVSEHIDILFLTREQELRLRKLCCPFYTSLNFQIKAPDFYLFSSEGYNLDKDIRSCFKRKRLYGKNQDGYILCDIEPAILGQRFNLGDKDIDKIIISSRHKGFSLFPIIEWPSYVHVARPLTNLETLDSIEESDIDLIAWAELYENKEDIDL